MKIYKTVVYENWNYKQWYRYDIDSRKETIQTNEVSIYDIIREMNNNGYFLSAIEHIGGKFEHRYFFSKEI